MTTGRGRSRLPLGLLLIVCCALGACAAESGAGPWVGSSRGEVYYWKECRAAQRLAPGNRVFFATEAEARAAGYRASRSRECRGPAATAPAQPAPPEHPTAARLEPCRVRRVTDGDSIVCEDGDRIRLLLVDAPELRQQPYGAQARRALHGLAPPGSLLWLETDVQPRDRYGRRLAYAWDAEGRLVNERLARQGYAVPLVYPPNVRHVDRIRAASEQARIERRGLWRTQGFECPPRDFRRDRC